MKICRICKSELTPESTWKGVLLLTRRAGHRTVRKLSQGVSREITDWIFDERNNLVHPRISLLYAKVCNGCAPEAERTNRLGHVLMLDEDDVPENEESHKYLKRLADETISNER